MLQSYTNISKSKELESKEKEMNECLLDDNLLYEEAEIKACTTLFSYI